jgi:GNAT superfamily N-acetyltransferase
MMIDSSALITITADNVRPDTAERVIAFTRQAYTNSDPLPGLPTPDGAVEGVDHLMRFLAGGGSVRVARSADGVVGLSRTSTLPDGALWVSRVAVAPAARGSGVGAALMARIEDLAADEGHRVVRLDAVIERCLAPYYSSLGYRVTAYHVPDDGKPLTEAAMERDLTRPRTPVPRYGVDPGARRVVAWYAGPTGMTAVVGADTDPAAYEGPGFAGLDAWFGSPADLTDLLRGAPGARHVGKVVRFAAPRADVPLHVRPRTVHPDLWALMRFRPGHEAGRERSRPTAPDSADGTRSDTCP